MCFHFQNFCHNVLYSRILLKKVEEAIEEEWADAHSDEDIAEFVAPRKHVIK